jgi:hypothetical protein
MAITKCPHCEGTFFEIKESAPQGAAYKAIFIQCSGCGAPFAAQDYYNLGALLKEQEAKIAELFQKVDQKFDQLDYQIRAILQALQR